MPYTKQVPEWNASGTKPPQSLIDSGWQFNQKPPADYFNWHWNSVFLVLNELQQYAIHSEKLAANNGIATLGADGKLTAAQLPAIGSSQITDGAITNNDLATDVKVGSLASLTTTAKGSAVAAINEVKTIADGKISSADKGVANGVATLGADSKLTASQLPAIGSAQITDGSITNADLATDVKVGSLASLKTAQKGSVVGAINEVSDKADLHIADYVAHVTAAERSTWNSKANGSHTHTTSDVAGLQTVLDGKSDTGHGHSTATTAANGFMSSADKTKLDGIVAGAQTNQNAFSNVKVGATIVAADSAMDTLELIAGTNISLTSNTTNDSITIDNTTPNASGSAAGLMSATDKAKLDGVAANANNYVHPSVHPATMITEDSMHRFATDAEKSIWNSSQLHRLTQNDGQSTQITDFNSATTAGFYYTNGVAPNNPTGAIGSVYYNLIVTVQGSEVCQIAHDKAGGRMFMRYKMYTGVWKEWTELYADAGTWTNVTYQNGWSTALSRPVKYKRVGNMLFVRGATGGGTQGDTTPVFTLPAAYRPATTFVTTSPVVGGTFVANGNVYENRLVVDVNGAVTLSSTSVVGSAFAMDFIIPLD